ncbi:MAG TPA: rod shape-determining protein MreC [Candidatus Paceibacterota bacterium]
MNYPLRNKPKHPNRAPIISVVVLFLIFCLSGFLFPNTLRSGLYSLSRPLWFLGGGVSSSFSKVKEFFVFRNNLISRNLSLEDQVMHLELKQVDYETLQKENQDLKSQLGRSDSSSHIISRVLSRPPQSPYDTFVIDVGLSDGVTVGSKVYISDSIIIGLVAEVTPHTSLVQLFSTGNRKQESTLLRTGASFVLEGLGGANFKLDVPKDADVLWGDVFVYPSLSSSVISAVYYIDTNSQSAFKTIYLRTPINVFSSQWVFVEKNNG